MPLQKALLIKATGEMENIHSQPEHPSKTLSSMISRTTDAQLFRIACVSPDMMHAQHPQVPKRTTCKPQTCKVRTHHGWASQHHHRWCGNTYISSIPITIHTSLEQHGVTLATPNEESPLPEKSAFRKLCSGHWVKRSRGCKLQGRKGSFCCMKKVCGEPRNRSKIAPPSVPPPETLYDWGNLGFQPDV